MKVVVAIDQTEYSKQIIDAVVKRHWPQDTCFKLLTVIEPFQVEQIDLAKWSKSTKEVLEKRTEAAVQVLKNAKARIERGIENSIVHVDVKQGDPKREILKAATEWMVDKIIVGAHGHVPNRILGSVPRVLSRMSPCSVELVRLKELTPTGSTTILPDKSRAC